MTTPLAWLQAAIHRLRSRQASSNQAAIRLGVSVFWRALVFTAVALLVSRDVMVDTSTSARVRRLIMDRQFDFVEWTVGAAGVKVGQSVLGQQGYLTDEDRKQFVLDYLELVREIQQIEGRINQLYTDPAESAPEVAVVPLRAELNDLHARRQRRQPLAEVILQDQIAAVLAALGIAPGGQPIPPVAFHVTPLPMAVIVSPRDVIRQDANLDIQPGLAADEMDALEGEIDRALDVSSLIVPLGGVGTYPTMIRETTNLNRLAEVAAHEWVHNFLTLRPLGMNIFSSPELLTMNETVANIAGQEIGEAVIARFYPELAPPPPPPEAAGESQPPPPSPPAFDFRAEMHLTRVQADELLARGEIEKAELYMELRRRFIVEHGYQIRKLNQAYFAFYGSYADRPGATGDDPIGPAIVELRQRSPTLAAFLKQMSWYTSFEQVQRALEK